MRRTLPIRICLALWGVLCTTVAFSAVAPVPDTEILAIIKDRIDVQKQSIGIVIGVIDEKGRRVISYGTFAKDDPRPVNGDTVYEIGSITKVFTALVLADMAKRGEVSLDDPVAKFLPPEVKVPQRGGKSIALVDLSTHTSGLPRLPLNFMPVNPLNPYADYTVEHMLAFVSGYSLPRDIGAQFEYSNLGAGLLGYALSRKAGMDYETLVRERIIGPLGMNDTSIALSPQMRSRLAVGHDAALRPTANWDVPALAGAGALRSTANDMLAFLAANMGYTESSLAPAMKSMLEVTRPAMGADVQQALGWQIATVKQNGGRIVSHGGGTGGYRTFIAFDPQAKVGIVALSNVSNQGIDDIGTHIVNPAVPLLQPSQPRQPITLAPEVLEKHVGQYALSANAILTVTRTGDQLEAQLTGQQKFPIFPSAEREFFYKVVDAQLTFHADAGGRTTSLTLHQNGRDLPAPRIEGEAPQPVQRTEIKVDPKILDGYVGEYQLAPNVRITVARSGESLFAQVTGQPMVQIYPESERKFFYKVVDAQITFDADSTGKGMALTLHQNGRTMPAPRVQ